ncbi:hypothetical protein [Stutzerimonas stutzeri]|uniref:hypothetical protein n=1 Tax=Stutzerimonas stutzeri TaxID=316 RepID=UPI00265CB4F2|nr:hypothetical protein [Stutzerimonas stutzeri]MCF6783442.1 hypothetical protein [Stutzerimonas stutzeri]
MSVVISSMDQFNEHVASGSKETLLLGGDLVYVTNEKATIERLQREAGDRYTIQQPRIASKGRMLEKKKSYLYIAVSSEAALFSQGYRGQVLLSADHYVAYGLSQKRDCIVIGGGAIDQDGIPSGEGDLNLEIYVFTANRLVETLERNTSATSYMLELTLQNVIDTYPDHAILWCDPLGDPPILDMALSDRFEVVGNAPFQHLIKRKLYTRSQHNDESWGLLPAAAIGLTGLTIFVAVTGYHWMGFERYRSEYNAEVAGFEAAYSNSSQSLDLLRHRSNLMDSTPDALGRVQLLEKLMNTAAKIDNVIVHSVKVFSDDDPQAQASVNHDPAGMPVSLRDEFLLEFSIPQLLDSSARDQAEPIVAMLNHRVGMTMRVIDHQSEAVSFGDETLTYWRYKVGGGRHGY